MTDAPNWSDPIPHDGSPECPADARGVAVCVTDGRRWFGKRGDVTGRGHEWSGSIAYRKALPPITDAMVERAAVAMCEAVSFDAWTDPIRTDHDYWRTLARAALTAAQGGEA